jgi:cytochrome c-type biogenesis protein CcmH
LVALLVLPVGAGSLYLRLGSPGLASETLTNRRDIQADHQTSIENLVAKVELHLQSNPKDGRGWEVLGPVYMQLGRYTDSANAWKNALLLLGESADREANLGESLVAEANGVVTEEAKSAFVRAVTLDNTTVSARYYLGMAAEQDGKREEAAKICGSAIGCALVKRCANGACPRRRQPCRTIIWPQCRADSSCVDAIIRPANQNDPRNGRGISGPLEARRL